MKKSWWYFFPLCLALGLGLYLYLNQAPERIKPPVEKIHLAVYRGLNSALIWVAESQGYFTENGLDAVITEYESGVEPVQQVLAGRADIGTAAEFVSVYHFFDDHSLKTIGTIDIGNSIELVARKDRGIQQPADLKGKKIGLKRKSQAEFVLGSFLTFNSLLQTDVELVNLEPGKMVDALIAGEVDAVSVWQPYSFLALQSLGSNGVSWTAQDNQPYYFLLNTTAEFVRERPDAVVRFLKAIAQAEHFVATEQAEAQKILQHRLQLKADNLKVFWQNHIFALTLPQELLYAMEDKARWMISNKLVEKTPMPNFFEFLSLDGLREVNPTALTVIDGIQIKDE